MKKILLLLIFLNSFSFSNEIIKVGVHKNFAPQYTINKNNSPDGFAIDLWKEIAKEANIKYKFIAYDNWLDIFAAMDNKEIDVIPNVRVSPMDKDSFTTTRSIELMEVGVFTRIDSNDIKEVSDLKNKKVIVRKKSIGLRAMKDHPKELLVLANSIEEAIGMLLNKKGDSFVFPTGVINNYLQLTGLDDKLKVLEKPILVFNRAVGVNLENKELFEKINNTLEAVLASQRYKEIYSKWHGKKSFWNTQKVIFVLSFVLILTAILFFIYKFYANQKIKKELMEYKKVLEEKVKEQTKIIENEKAKFQFAVDSAYGFFDWDIVTNRVSYSKGWKEIIGYREDEIKDDFNEWRGRVHLDDITTTMKEVKKHLNNQTAIYKTTFRMKHKNGHWVYIEVRGKAFRDENNKAIRLIGFHTDITEQKTESLSLDDAMSLASMATWEWDTINDIITWHDNTYDIYGVKRNSPINIRVIESLILDEDIQKHRNKVAKSLESYEPFDFDYRIIKDNEIRTLHAIGYPIIKDAKASKMVGIVQDITDIKEKDMLLLQQSKMAAMGEMIGNIAHQWRQPLSVIATGATGMLIQKQFGNLSDEQFEQTSKAINENAQYLSKTIDDFKNFIKGDRKKEYFPLKKCVKSFLNLIEGSLKNNNIELILDLNEDIIINGYEHELIQCLINITNNAKDALIENNIEDRYIFISAFEDQNSIFISIKDNANGIPNNIIDRVFEPYFTTKHQSHGTGLGLHMSYNLITQGMKGNIEVENETFTYKNKEYYGAKFKITLPLK